MRVLVVDINFEYKNPMYRQFYNHLSYCMEVDYFGPGYVDRKALEKGIKQFLLERECYDFILVGTYFVYSAELQGARYNAYFIHRRVVIPYYRMNDAYQCCRRILDELKDIDSVIRIFNYYEDSVSMPDGDYRICKSFLEDGFYLLSWPIQYMQIFHAKKIRQHPVLNNNAYKLAKEYISKYIPIPIHGISYPEIFARNYKEREYDWCVPGNKDAGLYSGRNKAACIAEKSNCKVWNTDPFQKLSTFHIQKKHMEWYEFNGKIEKAVSRVIGKNTYIPSYPKLIYIAQCRENYMESMRRSKKVYVDGGIGETFVRKYFEACACGALMVAKRIPGLEDLGFKDGVNCKIVEEFHAGILQEYIPDEKCKRLAKAGQQLILDKHMMHHRAVALRQTVEAIQNGTYQGAFWSEGNYNMKQ